MQRKYIILIIIIVFLILASFGMVKLVTDWFWFNGIGFGNIFTTILGSKIVIGLIAGLITFVLIYLNLRIASHFTHGRPISIQVDTKGTNLNLEKHLNKLILFPSLLLGFFTGLTVASYWETILKYLNTTPFNVADPIFSRDISFYFFTLPFLKILVGFFLWIIIISLIGSALIYFSRGAFSLFSKKDSAIQYSSKGKPIRYKIEKKPRIHFLAILFPLFLILAAQTYFIKIPSLVYSRTGPFVGASYTDIHATLPALKVLAFILLLGALASIISIFKKNNRLLFGVIGLYLVVSVLGIWLYPIAIQKLVVAPNELNKESPYIFNNITFTQKAFKLDQVDKHELSGETGLTLEDIQNNETTIKNIRLWDREPLLDTFGQIQEIRTYYDFISLDNDRYQLDEEYRQVLLSPRELNSESLPNRTFINEHLTFTHGFGLTLGPVNEVTKEGLPVLFIKDLPPVSTNEFLEVTQPEIYYGELAKNKSYVFVNTKANEFDYPSGEENVFTNYQGNGGVLIKSFWRKILFAARFGELKVLLSNDITSQSRVMYYRNIKQRVERVLPFLRLDSDPYLIITEQGKLKWIYDTYTTSNFYPYSQTIRGSTEVEGINYIRNSVKVVIDAYNGEMQFYIADFQDPLIQTYVKIFKNTFLSLEDMPEDIRAHIRYPEDIFIYQTALYSVYHMEKSQIFYNKEDQWQIPIISEGSGDPMMRHIIMKLPGETKEEYILMIPFTPQKKDNLAAWMVARSDGENYGKLAVYRFPKQRLVFGPKQIINRINQDPEISRQISLWDQRGSRVNLGSLLVIPIEESLLYIRPLYIRAEGGKIPELKRVIVAYEKRIAMEETLDEALYQVFGGTIVKTSKSEAKKEDSLEGVIQKDLFEEAKKYFDSAIEAQRRGDWSLYGEEIEKLRKIFEQ